jgi:hypothetical protein
MQGAQKLKSEAPSKVRRKDEVAAQRWRWTFYEAIIFELPLTPLGNNSYNFLNLFPFPETGEKSIPGREDLP